MRLRLRRLVGIGGAAAVAVGATLALSGVADAHHPMATPGCAKDGMATITITASDYKAPNGADKTPNTITVTVDGAKTPVATFSFGEAFDNTAKPLEIDGTKAHDVTVHFQAFDDPDGNLGFTKDVQLQTTVCEQPPPSSTTTVPPTTTTVPPTTTSNVVVPPTTTTKKKTAVAAELPNTGVSAAMPLALGGALVLVGGGLLFGMRMSSRRRHQN